MPELPKGEEARVVAEIVLRLFRHGKVGATYMNEQDFRQGVLGHLADDPQIREATDWLVEKGWALRHAKGVPGKNATVSLAPGPLAEAHAFAEKHLPEDRASLLPPLRTLGASDEEAASRAEERLARPLTREEVRGMVTDMLEAYVPASRFDQFRREIHREVRQAEAAARTTAQHADHTRHVDVGDLREELNRLNNRITSMREVVDRLAERDEASKEAYMGVMGRLGGLQDRVERNEKRVRVLRDVVVGMHLPPPDEFQGVRCALCEKPSNDRIHLWRPQGGEWKPYAEGPACPEHAGMQILWMDKRHRSQARLLAKDAADRGIAKPGVDLVVGHTHDPETAERLADALARYGADVATADIEDVGPAPA